MITQVFLWPLSPVLALMVTGLLVILAEAIWNGSKAKNLKFLLGILGPVLAIVFTWCLNSHSAQAMPAPTEAWLLEFVKTYRLDNFVLSLYWAIGFFTLLAAVFLEDHLKDFENRAEVLALLLWIASGMMLLVSANSLLMVFVALELMSLPTYVLVGMRRSDAKSSEAALKYFLFGSFGTVLLVLAIALFYAQFKTLYLGDIATALAPLQAQGFGPYSLAGLALLISGIGFKIGIAPFHMWVPDAYQGAPTPVTGFMGSAVKLAGFALAARVFWGMLGPMVTQFSSLFAVLAVITMFVGNLAALTQSNLKRMLAYSSVSHAGYLFLGIASIATGPNYPALQYYLVIYGLMFIGLFGILSWIEDSNGSVDIHQLNGLGFTHPWTGAALAIFALSAAGIPPTAGFFAKYFLFLEAMRSGHSLFVILGVISSLIGVYYYLRILVHLYMKDRAEKPLVAKFSRAAFAGILACAGSLIYFSLFP